MNKTLLGYIIMIIIVIIIGIVIHFNKNHCIKNGGKRRKDYGKTINL